MNIDQKLTAIRDVIQQDIGNRGLARDPARNLFSAFPDDFANGCRSIADHPSPAVGIVTGFMIPIAIPIPRPETDGPLGAAHLLRAFGALKIPTAMYAEEPIWICLGSSLHGGIHHGEWLSGCLMPSNWPPAAGDIERMSIGASGPELTHLIAVERAGPNHTLESLWRQPATSEVNIAAFAACVPEQHRSRCYTMKGHDITRMMFPAECFFDGSPRISIGIGDGGNEIGMGKLPWDTVRRNIPNGGLIACRVATDHLIVAGVSNWGAYGLAAGVALLRGVELPAELFDPDRERELLQVMVDAGPLVDGVTGRQTATVDGLSWDDYIKPLVEIGRIVRA